MKFGKFIMNGNYISVENKKPFLDEESKHNRRAVDLYDNGGLVAFRNIFAIPDECKCVKITVAALGVFEVYINGTRVGNDEMKPGWTDYRKTVFEFEYDVTGLCKQGEENILVACVAPGWYAGRISNKINGDKGCAFCGEITVTDKKGDAEVLATDESWETSYGGRVRTGEIWDGELYDAREKCIFSDSDSYEWTSAVLAKDITCQIIPHIGETVKIKKKNIVPVSAVLYDGVNDNGSDFGEINVISCKIGNDCEIGAISKGQRLILDFGADICARPRFKLYAPNNTTVKIHCGEMLNDSGMLSRGNDGAKGCLYMANYRNALSRIQYISNGETAEYTPSYSFFGYRYLEIEADNDIEIVYVVSDIIGSDLKKTGYVETSNAEVNKLIGNIYRGLESNYLSIPTDCPQRDERWGWTGDTQIFCGAAAYFVNAYGFLSKWMGDMRDSRDPDGVFPFVAPAVFSPTSFGTGSAAWCDAGIIVPYKMWLMYGDKTILEENYEAMETYINGILARYGISGPHPGFGDWLCYEENRKDCVAVCYFYYDASLMEKISLVLNKPERAEYYAELKTDINTYYKEKFIENGELKVTTQTGYLLPLAFDMLDGELRNKAIEKLKAKIIDNDYTLATGFVGTGLLNQTLNKVGLDDEAYSLLLQTKDPSWLYSVRQGATTVWERWNSYTLENGFGDVSMNSFNHYAYGAVAEWMFSSMAGIKPVEDYPGFEKFILAPIPDTRELIPEGQERITSVKAEFESAHGLICAEWYYENGKFVYKVTVPKGAEARVEFPLLYDETSVNVNGLEFSESDSFNISNGKMIFTLTAGDYIIK